MNFFIPGKAMPKYIPVGLKYLCIKIFKSIVKALRQHMTLAIETELKKTSSLYDCTVEGVEYSSHLVVVITLP